MSAVSTTCPYCGVGCGVLATPDGQGGASIAGDPAHPANFGRLCSKGSALGETLDPEGRLLAPQIAGDSASWDAALDLVAGKFRAAIEAHGPDSVAFYVSGQLLTEDYYVANKLMKGFIGSANIDTNSRLCMASSVAGHKRAFGTDTVPGTYEDLELADLVVLVGSNLAWCHPVLYQRLAAAKAERPNMKVVVVDPRRTATCDIADMHLAIAPGGDVALFQSLLVHLADGAAMDRDYLGFVNGMDEALALARAGSPERTGLLPEDIARFCALFAQTQKVVTVYSQGVNQAHDGTDRVNAILNCHLATGRIGKPGMGPFSVTGQPNAMGGREVGGLANMLAAHLDLENADHMRAVQDFWQAPHMPSGPGLKAVDLFNAVADGKIKALWVMSTNPAVSMPEANHVRDAIKGCAFTVVSDIMARTDTGDLADVLLPATGWGEKNGTVTNSDRTISRQRAFLPAPGETRPDWRMICDVAERMGWGEAFAYESAADVFREHAALSALAGKFGRDFDISAVADISDAQFEAWEPTRWPITPDGGQERFFADGKFFKPDGKAQAVPVAPSAPLPAVDPEFPLRLNTGRVRDHWHTMTRTAKSPRLGAHLAEPYLEINPSDAEELSIAAADLVEITGVGQTALLRALITDRVRAGEVFAPIHWTAQTASRGRIDALVPGQTDPVSGQPALKSARVRLAPYKADWYAFVVSAQTITPQGAYWAVARREDGYSAELAGMGAMDAQTLAQMALGEHDWSSLSLTNGTAPSRMLFRAEGKLVAAVFVSPEPVELSRSFVVAQLAAPVDGALLAGRPPAGQRDAGATVCSCFNVGVNTIVDAIETRGLMDVDAIGDALQAGTNCGSCRPELKALLAAAQRKVAAE